MKRIIPLFLLMFFSAGLFAQVGTLTVTNVVSTPGTGVTVIHYEFSGQEGAYDISAEVSFNNGANYADIPDAHLTGDVSEVTPGGIYSITWDGMAGFPERYSEETVVRLTATPIMPETFTLSMEADPAEGGAATDETDAGPYVAGTVINIKAEPNAGYAFKEWTATAGSFGDTGLATTTFTMPAGNVTVTANFEQDEEPVFNSCGDPITFTYNDETVTYGTISKTYNEGTDTEFALCWMDRNLGATRPAQSSADADAYGDLFQWGRLSDGHQDRGSTATSTLSATDVPGHGDFITVSDSPYDWRAGQNNNLWQGGENDNNPCPPGWRVPTEAELEAERLSWGTGNNNSAGAFASDLKWPVGGSRRINGEPLNVGNYG